MGGQSDAASVRVLPHETFVLSSKVLGEMRRINIYTPPGYTESSGARYPVLYMPDGGVEEDFPHVTGTIDAAIRANEMRPSIVVGIENTVRKRDMTGQTDVVDDRKIGSRVGGSALFRAFISDELMPDIHKRVRGSGETAIIGESLAGLFVVETFFVTPNLFDTYIALSSSLWWNDDSLVRHAGERLLERRDLRVTIYLASANEDNIVPQTARLAEALRARAPKGLIGTTSQYRSNVTTRSIAPRPRLLCASCFLR
jgi:predicted alpha/beta superfamily hydrolase